MSKKQAPSKRQAAKKAAPRTDSGPASARRDAVGAPQAEAARLAEAWSSEREYNVDKAAEHDRENALDPPEGTHVPAPAPEAAASTVSERNDTGKTGESALPGMDAGSGPLLRVRNDAGDRVLTTNQGVAVADNQNSLKAGLRGPALLKDFILREKITHFDHERIPERIVHARGSGAHGYFEAYESLSDLTRAAPFAEAGKQTPVFVRFSTVAGERGSKDTARDVRGFAVKFYTDEGNWDLVGNNMPVFFIQDAMKFPDLVHAVKPEPHHGMPQAASAHDTFWDFVSLMPESAHMLMWLMSDRAIPRSFRMMQGFGVHTFRLVNADGDSVFCKFHWIPRFGTHSLVWEEAVKISGADPDFHRRDLWEAIEAGDYPEYELGLQIFTPEQAEAFSFDVLDATKIVPEELVPLRMVGRLVLNRNPDNFFAETEQVAFCAAHVIPGIDFTNDPLLAGRIHSYVDTQISRLGGPNFHEIPINAPVAPVHNNQRDGMHRQAIHRGRVSYEPNSLGGGCPFQAGAAGFVSFPEPPEGDEVRAKPEKFAEHFNQATLFYESQTAFEKRHIAAGFRFELSKVTVPAIRRRMVSMLRNVSETLAAEVAAGLGMALPPAMPRALEPSPAAEVTLSPALSLEARPGDGGIRTRRVAVLATRGVRAEDVRAIVDTLAGHGAGVRVVGPHVGALETEEGQMLDADASVENAPSVLFDAVVLPAGDEAVALWSADGRVLEFVRDAWRHGKAILALGTASQVLSLAGIEIEAASDTALVMAEATNEDSLSRFIGAIARHRNPERETDPPRA
nr:catalase [Pseudoxanthomonas sp.]